MQLDEKEQKQGAIWFFVVGPIGFILILFLARVDSFLTYTDSEQRHADNMAELRLAQTSLTTRTLDDRNAGTRAYRAQADFPEVEVHIPAGEDAAAVHEPQAHEPEAQEPANVELAEDAASAAN